MKQNGKVSAKPESPGRHAPTSYDVARRAGVSQSAVSRCFREGASIAAATRSRVLAAARELGYQPNAMASGLITRRTGLVAVLISNLTNLYYPEVLAELTTRLAARDIRVLLFTLQAESDVDAALAQVWRYRVDGAIVAARLSREQLRDFQQQRVPVVLYNRFGEGEHVASVCCDSAAGERVLVDQLVAAGCRTFGIIAGPEDSYVSAQRVAGAQQRLADHGLSALVTPGRFDYESGKSGLLALWAQSGGAIDALICANDLMAIGAVDCARNQLGIAVPDALSIVGFDGVAPAAWDSYRITTIRQPVKRMSEAAVAMIIERIADHELPPEVRTFAGMLMPGGSARLVAKAPR